MRVLTILALLQATLAGVPVAVRNLVGRDVIVAWLQPGPEPRTRIPQQAKPLTNSSVMSIDSFATHEFIVYDAAAEQQSNIKKPDGHESCEFWASVGECAANPGYMLVTCANACDNLSKKKNNGELKAIFAVAESTETVSVVDNDGVWEVVRTGPAHDASKAVERALDACSATHEEGAPTCGEATVQCVSDELQQFFSPKRDELSIEKFLFDHALKIAPKATPDPDAKGAAYSEDLPKLYRDIERASKETDLSEACPDGARECLRDKATHETVFLTSTIGTLRKATRARRHDVRNATCRDHVIVSPHSPVVEKKWKYDPYTSDIWAGPPPSSKGPAEPERKVRYLFDPSSIDAQIIVIDDFISDEECDAVQTQATPRLARATHAHEGDLSHVSKARDSQQATVRPEGGRKNERDLSDPIARLKARSVAMANHLSNYTLQLDGQEDLMAVQYNPGQQYMLHCDGSCDGTPFVSGGRLATVLMYCAAADGGGTAFPNAGVHVVPKRGQAVYFSFRSSDSEGLMEDWHTEHSGCPVREGSKWVVTQWLRDGVSKENPHSRFDPSGGPVR